MIKLIEKGSYRIVVDGGMQRILYLGDRTYLWSHAKGIGELLSFSKRSHRTLYLLAIGKYRIYTVKDEPKYVDLRHLELLVGPRTWQGFLLLTGLPNEKKIRSRIVPTKEIISRASADKRSVRELR